MIVVREGPENQERDIIQRARRTPKGPQFVPHRRNDFARAGAPAWVPNAQRDPQPAFPRNFTYAFTSSLRVWGISAGYTSVHWQKIRQPANKLLVLEAQSPQASYTYPSVQGIGVTYLLLTSRHAGVGNQFPTGIEHDVVRERPQQHLFFAALG
jgi:hypothetical protein